jgi:Fe-S cluster assembly iron-binding protein IscA
MDIAKGAEKEDVTLVKDGLKVFLEKEANELLSEATIDFSGERGIIISGMRQSSRCC